MNEDMIDIQIADGIAHLSFGRSAQLNAFNNELMRETLAAMAALNDNDDVRVIIVSGQGRAFSAGFDLKAASERALETREEWREQLKLQFVFIMSF